MGLKDKMNKYLQDSYMEKYGDRVAIASGTVVSVKFTEKNYIIIKKLIVDLVIKSDTSRGVVKATYKKNRWFKKPEFIPVKIGNKVIVMGLKGIKGKKDADVIVLQNLLNLTTKKDLAPFDHSQLKKAKQQATKMQRR